MRRRRRKNNLRPMGTFDHLIISMGIHLAHIHERENVLVLSTDARLIDILDKCRAGLPAKTINKLKLKNAEQVTGKPFKPEIFPKGINLSTANKSELVSEFGGWPLSVGELPSVYRWTKL